MIIPDAIEPVVGWRCFDVVDGLLVSPQKRMPWPAVTKAKAACSNDRWSYQWLQLTPKERQAMEEEAAAGGFTAALGEYVNFLMSSGEIEKVPVYMPWGMRGRVPPVQFYPEPGKEWVLRILSHGHAAPHESCHCGIHIASDISMALQYRGHTVNDAIGFVKGWGKVIPASRGYRVEFAYPERLYLFHPPDGGRADLHAYEVPIESVLKCEEYVKSMGIAWIP